MKNLRFIRSGFWLLFVLSLATVVFNACSKDEQGEEMVVTNVSLDETALMLGIGEYYTLTATVMPDKATNKTIMWTSSDKTKVTVDNDGNVSAVAAGTATITAKAGDRTATCVITVSTSIVAVTGISLDKASLTLAIGKNQTLTATVMPIEATNKTIMWTSSDNSKVSVANGKITAIATGTAIITAKAGNKTATCTVTVSTAPKDPKEYLLSVTWNKKAEIIKYYENEVIISEENTNTLENQWIFAANGYVTMKSSGITRMKNYTYAGNSLEITSDIYTVKELTETTLVLEKIIDTNSILTVTFNKLSASDPSGITIDSKAQYAALIEGKQYHEFDECNGVSGGGVYSSYVSKFAGSEVKELFEVVKGKLSWPNPFIPYGNFCFFFSEGDYAYSSNPEITNGVEIIWYDESRTKWSTSFGSANQTGSTFTITDSTPTKSSMYAGDYDSVKVRILFSCTLYDGNGNSKKVENGVFVGRFENF